MSDPTLLWKAWGCDCPRLQAESEQVGRLVDDGTPGRRFPWGSRPPTVEPAVPLDVDQWWREVAAGTAFVDPLYVAQRFLSRVQWEPLPPFPLDVPAGWLQLPETPGRPMTWEHASWVAASDLTDGFLAPVVRPDDWLVDDSGWSSSDRVRAVAAARGELVALLSRATGLSGCWGNNSGGRSGVNTAGGRTVMSHAGKRRTGF